MAVTHVVLAYFLDLMIGDPAFFLHPVKILGRIISWWEKRVMPKVNKPLWQRVAGLIFTLSILLATYFGTMLLISGVRNVSELLFWLLNVYLISTTLTTKGLKNTAEVLRTLLSEGKIEKARKILKDLVGRDTGTLQTEDMVRATIESVAENTTDGIVAPLFYAFIGGAPLAMVYRAVNTMDSMLGYRSPPYLYWGWASARMDDVLNYLPARIIYILMPVAALLLGKSTKNSIRIMLRDGKKHPSPNSGIPEAAMAGALRVQLGGFSIYKGRREFRPYLGDAIRELSPSIVGECVEITYVVSILMVITCLIMWLGGIIIGT